MISHTTSSWIPAVLAWVPGKSKAKARPPHRFPLEHTQNGTTTRYHLDLVWSLDELKARDPDVGPHAKRLRAKRSAQREHVTELAAYGLSLVAISVLMPGRRVVAMRDGLAPDFLFDVTPGRLRGVETAGRSKGGRRALLVVRDGTKTKLGKRTHLLERSDIHEVSLSLWSGSARVGIMEQVKP